jgi:hypothetical protein
MRTLILVLAVFWSGLAMAYDNQRLLRDAPPPAQGMVTAEDPLAMWFRSPAGQYWKELTAARRRGEIATEDTIPLHKQRFPDDGGPSAGGPRPSQAGPSPTLNAPTQTWSR